MSYSGPITIYEHNGWKLDSYGNGAAYSLRRFRGADQKSISVSIAGDDASDFRNQFDCCGDDEMMEYLFSEYIGVMTDDED